MNKSEKQNIQASPIDDIFNLGTESMNKVLLSEGPLIYVAEFTGTKVNTWVVCNEECREQLTEAIIKPEIEIEGKEYHVNYVGISAFKDCINLRRVEIPEGIEKIFAAAFAETAVEEIKLPNSLKYLGFGAFSGCTRLKKVSIPSSCEINGDPFAGCSKDLIVETY